MDEITRHSQLARLREQGVFDLLVVGGGATGLGTAVDAAKRGHRVALVERYDFGKGTSSRSTKLVHGGVRYLRQGNIRLVREALRERGRFIRNAPHLARDLEFVIPAWSRFDRAFYGVGLKAYDFLAGRWSLGASRLLDRQETLRRLPTLDTAGLRGGVLYHDGQFDDGRMTINLMQTAVELGAVAVNYCECARLLPDSTGRLTGAVLRDREDGETFTLRAKAVINATGVFVDELRAREVEGARGMVAVSQGIHIVLPRRFLPGDCALMIPKTSDGRVLFAVPWHGAVIVGTTDTPVREANVEPRALPQEYAFVMECAAKHLTREPRDEDVLSVFAGLRPLVRRDRETNTAALSRGHAITIGRSGLITVTGGKWTTYRQMAQEVVDHAETVAGLAPRPSGTADFPIHGADPGGAREDSRLARLALYGSDAREISSREAAEPGASAMIHPELSCSVAEVRWHARHEMAMTVEDVLSRRTRALLLNARAAAEAAPVVAALLARERGKGEAWVHEQVTAFRALAQGYLPAGSSLPR